MLLTCCGCDHVFTQTVSSNSEDRYQYYDDNGREVTDRIVTIGTWPARSKCKILGWFSRGSVETDLADRHALDSSLKEFYGALNQDLVVLASIGVRTSFGIASEILGVASSAPGFAETPRTADGGAEMGSDGIEGGADAETSRVGAAAATGVSGG